MLLTIAKTGEAKSLVENTPPATPHFPDIVRKRILNSTVKLMGTGKDRVSSFIASGVIFTMGAGNVTILTAAHNLMAWAKLPAPPASWDADASGFRAAVSIWFGNGAAQERDLSFDVSPTGRAAIESVTVPAVAAPCDRRRDCLYDLMVITSAEGRLLNYARKFVFNDQKDSDIASATKQEANLIIKRAAGLLNRNRYDFVQLGYGKKSDERYRIDLDRGGRISRSTRVAVGGEVGPGGRPWYSANTLHYQIVSTSYTVFKNYYNQTAINVGDPLAYFEYAEAISLVGRRSGTTGEGDSGGPLYAVDKKNPKAYLLGLTTGADMQPSKKPMKPYKNLISTSVAPYLKTVYET